MSFLNDFDTLDPAGQVSLLRQWLAQRPAELFAELRHDRPILFSPMGIFVTKYRDVLEVLSRHEVFSVRLYAPKMERVTGPFILGLDDTPIYQRDVSVLRLAFRREDLHQIRANVAYWSADMIRSAAADGRLEIVSGVTRAAPTRLVAEYFGTPGPDEATLAQWARTIFHDIFLNLADDVAIREAALASADEMRKYLDGLIAERRRELDAGATRNDTVLDRLLGMQWDPRCGLDNVTIRHNLIGLIVGAIDTTSKALAQLMDQLLLRPDQLRTAQEAVRSGDDALLSRCVFEALRFNPQNTMLFRFCESQYTLAKGTPRAATIPRGQLVFAATMSAMFDEDELDAPEEFRVDRPDYHYLHFGYGLHTCFGRYINSVQIPEIARQILSLPGLRRAPGTDGELKFEGPFPQSLVVEFDP